MMTLSVLKIHAVRSRDFVQRQQYQISWRGPFDQSRVQLIRIRYQHPWFITRRFCKGNLNRRHGFPFSSDAHRHSGRDALLKKPHTV